MWHFFCLHVLYMMVAQDIRIIWNMMERFDFRIVTRLINSNKNLIVPIIIIFFLFFSLNYNVSSSSLFHTKKLNWTFFKRHHKQFMMRKDCTTKRDCLAYWTGGDRKVCNIIFFFSKSIHSCVYEYGMWWGWLIVI